GKPAEGSVHIKVAREATEVVIRVSDDGRGLNREAIRKRGIERGLLRAETRPTDNQLLSLITQPGFSTASKVTQLAGRGVGMDVVANEIKQLGGSLSIESEEGQGATFVLRLPFTLAVTQAILVRIGEATFAIPMTSVQGVARVNPDDLTALLAEDEPSFQYGNEEYGIHDLAELLGLPPGLPTEDEQQPLLLTRACGDPHRRGARFARDRGQVGRPADQLGARAARCDDHGRRFGADHSGSGAAGSPRHDPSRAAPRRRSQRGGGSGHRGGEGAAAGDGGR